jgi:hypothetical protein
VVVALVVVDMRAGSAVILSNYRYEIDRERERDWFLSLPFSGLLRK